jgi:ABC-2 type transport system permease protein
VLAAVGLLVLVGFSMSWVGAFYGMIVRSPDAANGLGMSTLVPLCFLANTFVPSTNLPPVLKAISDWNPVSATVAATRQLFGNPGAVHAHPSWPLAHPIIASLAWAVLIVAVFLPLSAQRYRSSVR